MKRFLFPRYLGLVILFVFGHPALGAAGGGTYKVYNKKRKSTRSRQKAAAYQKLLPYLKPGSSFNKTFTPALCQGVREGDTGRVGLLLDLAGKRCYRVDGQASGLNAFQLALVMKHNPSLKLLLDFAAAHPARIKLKRPLPVDYMEGQAGAPPGHVILQTGNVQGLQLLLRFALKHPQKLNFNVSAPYKNLKGWKGLESGATLLHLAAIWPDITYLRLLVKALRQNPRLLNVNARLPHRCKEFAGATPFCLAVYGQNAVQALRLLLQVPNLNPNTGLYDGTTPLCLAAKISTAEVVALLAGTTPVDLMNQEDEDSQTPLLYACARGDLAMVEALLKAGADGNTCSSFDDCTPMGLAVLGNHLRIVRALLAYQVHYIYVPDYDNILELALKSGVDLPSSFFLACHQGYTDSAIALLSHPNSHVCGQNVDPLVPADNPLLVALCKGHHTLVTEVLWHNQKKHLDLFYYNTAFLSFVQLALQRSKGRRGRATSSEDKLGMALVQYSDSHQRGVLDLLYILSLLAEQAAPLQTKCTAWISELIFQVPSPITPATDARAMLNDFSVPPAVQQAQHVFSKPPFAQTRIRSMVQSLISWVLRYDTAVHQAFDQLPVRLPREIVSLVQQYSFSIPLHPPTQQWLRTHFFSGKNFCHALGEWQRFKQHSPHLI